MTRDAPSPALRRLVEAARGILDGLPLAGRYTGPPLVVRTVIDATVALGGGLVGVNTPATMLVRAVRVDSSVSIQGLATGAFVTEMSRADLAIWRTVGPIVSPGALLSRWQPSVTHLLAPWQWSLGEALQIQWQAGTVDDALTVTIEGYRP